MKLDRIVRILKLDLQSHSTHGALVISVMLNILGCLKSESNLLLNCNSHFHFYGIVFLVFLKAAMIDRVPGLFASGPIRSLERKFQ